MKSVSIDQITACDPERLKLRQSAAVSITEVLPPAISTRSSLVFSSSKALFNDGLVRGAQAFVLLESVFDEVKGTVPPSIAIWTTDNIQAAMSVILPLFDSNKKYFTQGIHPSAFIHPSAKVTATADIGAFCVIEAEAIVGENTVLLPHVYVGPRCEIGSRCWISPHVTIGSDGFGFYTDKKFSHHKIPQIGKVVIEDDCEFGSHCAIDRATLTETRIKRGSKFDNFCHIAHNVRFGENALVAAGFIVAGSTEIGKNFMTSGGVHVLGHLKIADNVILSARAGAMQSIETSGMYGGFPLEPHRESVKTLMSIPHLKTLRKQVHRILKHLNLNPEE